MIKLLFSNYQLTTTLYKISNNTKLYISAVSLYELYMGAT